MKIGFTLKKAKKPTLGAPGAAVNGEATSGGLRGAFEATAKVDPTAQRVYVTDFDPTAVAGAVGADGEVRPAIVIPLIKANAWQSSADDEAASPSSTRPTPSAADVGGEGKDLSADELAARALIAEATGAQQDGDAAAASSTLVIPMASVPAEEAEDDESEEDAARRAKRAALFNFDGTKKDPAAVPILQQNAVPGMDALADVTDKYRHDVSLRPDALDVHSGVYEAIPIEEFGAAMLRGMGWKGSVDKDAESADIKPRHKLLGLGATAKPPMPGEDPRRTGHRRNPTGLSSGAEPTRSNGLNRTRRDDRQEDTGASSRSRRPRDSERSRSRDSRSRPSRHEAENRSRRDDREDSRDRRTRERSRSREHRRDKSSREGSRRRSRSRDRSDDRRRSHRR